eukprot:gene1907-5595_t
MAAGVVSVWARLEAEEEGDELRVEVAADACDEDLRPATALRASVGVLAYPEPAVRVHSLRAFTAGGERLPNMRRVAELARDAVVVIAGKKPAQRPQPPAPPAPTQPPELLALPAPPEPP